MRDPIAVVTIGDPRSPSTWSGIPAHMCAALERLGEGVAPIAVSPRTASAMDVARNAAARPRGHVFDWGRKPAAIRAYAREVEAGLLAARPRAVLAPGSLPVSALGGDVPVIIWADATVPGMLGYYDFAAWSPATRDHAVAAERRAFSRATAWTGASQWAVDSATSGYPEAAAKVHLVPFGANLATRPPQRPPRRCAGRILSVGVDWRRKGIDIAVETAAELRNRGIAAELDVVGCLPPRGTSLPDFVRVHGFIDKDTAGGRAQLDRLYEAADVFVLPTRAEAFGIVFCEAAAFGMPSVAPRTGGVPTAVLDGRTGVLLDASAPASEYADAVQRMVEEPSWYATLCHASRDRYERELNWESACRSVLDLLPV